MIQSIRRMGSSLARHDPLYNAGTAGNQQAGMNGCWVFGYASLVWKPGIVWQERGLALVLGWHRSCCLASIAHRGTSARPAPFLPLDAAAGAACNGVAFAVSAVRAVETLSALRERELISSAYLEKVLRVDLADGRQVEALTY